MENLSKIFFILLFLSSCSLTQYTYDPIYEDHPHTTEVYWYTDYEVGGTPYFGYWDNFYYYYGVPHFYPWWYYYQFIPPYHYHTHSHVHVHCDNGHYVYGHRGPLFHNTGPDCTVNQGRFVPTIKPKNNKDKSFVFPRNWKSSNSTRINKHNDHINKINVKPNNTINFNKNRSNNKIQINNKSNTNRSNKSNTNRSNKKRP
tara:strand:+ start:191 stop:793 length:603 start_codon:yes stop_codon:yes gene_type:complete